MPNELVFSIPETSLSSKSQSNSLTMNMTDLRTTIFVGNLSVFCTEQDLEQVFSRYGTILEIRMAKSEDRSKHLSYGFIKFASVASAQLAMIELDGRILCGRPLKVGRALSRSNRKVPSGKSGPQQYDTASVHVTFISNQLSAIITEESLRNLFAQFGEVVDAVICKSSIDQRTKRQSGYGFIHFHGTPEGINASFRAAQSLMDIMIDEVNYKCKISHQLEQQLLRSSSVDTEERALPTEIPSIYLNNPDNAKSFSSVSLPSSSSSIASTRYNSFTDSSASARSFLSARSQEIPESIGLPRPQYSNYQHRNAFGFPSNYPQSSFRQTQKSNSIGDVLDGMKEMNLSSVSVDTGMHYYPSVSMSSNIINNREPLISASLIHREHSTPFLPFSNPQSNIPSFIGDSLPSNDSLDEDKTVRYL